MAHNVYIRGVGRAGFRVPAVGATSGLARVNKNGTTQVDLDNHKTQLLLSSERNFGNFVRVSGSGATTATIFGLSRRGFRIPRSSDGKKVMVKVGSGVTTVDLTNPVVCRILYRSKRDWAFAADPTVLQVYGIMNAQNAFELHGLASGVLTSDNTVPSNGDTVTLSNGGTWAQNNLDIEVLTPSTTYTFVTALSETHATATLNSDGTVPTAGDTVTINNVTYRFESTLAQANDVKIGATSDATLTSLAKAVNQNGVVGTDYFTGTVAPTGVTSGTLQGTGATGHLIFTATALGTGGNAFASTETSAHLSFSNGATFTGGVNAVANQVLIAGTADLTLTNLLNAVTGGSGVGTNYSTGTTNLGALYTVTGPTSHALTFTAKVSGIDYPVSENSAHLSWSGTELVGGIAKIYRGQSATVDATNPFNYQQLRRHYDRWIEA